MDATRALTCKFWSKPQTMPSPCRLRDGSDASGQSPLPRPSILSFRPPLECFDYFDLQTNREFCTSSNDHSLAVRPSYLLFVRICHELSCRQDLFEKSARLGRGSWAGLGAAARERYVQCGTVASNRWFSPPSINPGKEGRPRLRRRMGQSYCGWAGLGWATSGRRHSVYEWCRQTPF